MGPPFLWYTPGCRTGKIKGRSSESGLCRSESRKLFRSLYGYLAEILHELRDLQSRLAGTGTGSLVALLYLSSGVSGEYFEFSIDFCYQLFHVFCFLGLLSTQRYKNYLDLALRRKKITFFERNFCRPMPRRCGICPTGAEKPVESTAKRVAGRMPVGRFVVPDGMLKIPICGDCGFAPKRLPLANQTKPRLCVCPN